MRILIVDDNASVRHAIARVLLGHVVKIASDATEALEILESSFIPDVVLTDVLGLGMPPEEFLAELRKRVACPIVAVTGVHAPQGYDGVVVKPMNASTLLRALRAAKGST